MGGNDIKVDLSLRCSHIKDLMNDYDLQIFNLVVSHILIQNDME